VWGSGFGVRVQCLGYRVQGFGLRVQGLKSRVWARNLAPFEMKTLVGVQGVRVWGLGMRGVDVGCRV